VCEQLGWHLLKEHFVKVKKIILWTIPGVVVLVVLTVVIAWAVLDTIVMKGIQHGGEYALGVPTQVADVKISLLKGSLEIDQMNIGNPAGFSSPHLIKSGTFSLDIKPTSVFANTVDISRFVLDGLDVNIEQGSGKNNISAMLDHVKQLGGGSSGTEGSKADGGGKKIRVALVSVRNVVAHVYLQVPGAMPLTINVPAIELMDVTGDSPDGVTISVLMGRLMPAIMASIVKSGNGVIPQELAGILNQDLAASAAAMGGQASKLVQQIGGNAAELINQNTGTLLKESQKALPTSLPNPIINVLPGLSKPKDH
jgi:hypothetical protein